MPRRTQTRADEGKERYVYGWEAEQLPEWDRWAEDRIARQVVRIQDNETEDL